MRLFSPRNLARYLFTILRLDLSQLAILFVRESKKSFDQVLFNYAGMRRFILSKIVSQLIFGKLMRLNYPCNVRTVAFVKSLSRRSPVVSSIPASATPSNFPILSHDRSLFVI